MSTVNAHPATGTSDDDSRAALATGGNLGWLLIALVSLGGFVVLTVALLGGIVFPFDQSLLATARSWDGWSAAWNALSQSANIPLIVIGLGFVVWLFLARRRREAFLVLLVLIAVTAGSEGVKQLVGRPRPSGSGDGIPGVVYSYPSGHTLEVLSILGMITVRWWRSERAMWLRLGLAFLVTIEVVLVGVARLALNEHYPTDVLAGLLGGIGAVSLYAWFTRPGAWADHPPAKAHEPSDSPKRGLEVGPSPSVSDH